MENNISKCTDCGCGKEEPLQYESSTWQSTSLINLNWSSNDGK